MNPLSGNTSLFATGPLNKLLFSSIPRMRGTGEIFPIDPPPHENVRHPTPPSRHRLHGSPVLSRVDGRGPRDPFPPSDDGPHAHGGAQARRGGGRVPRGRATPPVNPTH